MKVKVSLDEKKYYKKPDKSIVPRISDVIAKQIKYSDLESIAQMVGNEGHTFCPAVFRNGVRRKENFEQMQLFVLDFDNGIPYKDIASMAEKYNLPIAFSYKTFSWMEDKEKFRIIFCHVVPIKEKGLAELMLHMLKEMFSEVADKGCFEVARMFYGGKGLIEGPYDVTFRADELVESFQKFMFIKDRRNYMRNILTFASKHNLGMSGKMLYVCTYKCGVGDCPANLENDAEMTNSIIYTIELVDLTSVIVFYGRSLSPHRTDMCDQSEKSESNQDISIEQLKNITESQIKSVCSLYRDFARGIIISHNERFMLATNFLHINGMKKRFLQVIEKYYDSILDWKYHWEYISSFKYKPQGCDKMCPYADRCVHDVSLYLTLKGRKRITRLNSDEKYKNLEECYFELKEAFEDAILTQGKAIHLVSGQTGLGKTQVYIEYLRKITTPVIIAVPTVELEQEIAERMGEFAIKSISLKELVMPEELSERIRGLYSRGLYKEVQTELNSYMRQLPDGAEKDRYRQYLSFSEKLEDPQRHIIITHMRLLQMSEYERFKIRKFPIIIDEDILLTIFRNTKSVSIADIQKAVDNRLLSNTTERDMKELLKMSDGSYMKSSSKKDDTITYISEKTLDRIGISGNINELMNAGAYYKEDKRVDYFVPLSLPDSKIIVFSATMNTFLYKKYFKNQTIIEHKVSKAKYTGRLLQYPYYSMSRRCMSELAEQLGGTERLKEILNGIADDIEYRISFKKCEAELECIKHYGNAAGFDSLKGKNGMIIGTPHLKESSYKLIACYLGIVMKDKNTEIRRQQVKYGHYRFNMMSYEQELLQEIQLYMISSELEQCIGRSRLLRERVSVYVFSNFPCEQAEFYPNDYLEEYLKATEDKINQKKENAVCNAA